MDCYICGTGLVKSISDLPFKVSGNTIAIIKNLPIMECPNCKEYLIEDPVLKLVDSVLNKINPGAELEIIDYSRLTEIQTETIQ